MLDVMLELEEDQLVAILSTMLMSGQLSREFADITNVSSIDCVQKAYNILDTVQKVKEHRISIGVG